MTDRAVPIAKLQIVRDPATRRQVGQKRIPPTSRRKLIKDRVQHFGYSAPQLDRRTWLFESVARSTLIRRAQDEHAREVRPALPSAAAAPPPRPTMPHPRGGS